MCMLKAGTEKEKSFHSKLVSICLHILFSQSWNDICLICPEEVLKNKSCNRQDPGP